MEQYNINLPAQLEIGMHCVTHDGQVVKITSDDMLGYTYESFLRLATPFEILSLNSTKISNEILEEVINQYNKWGIMNHPSIANTLNPVNGPQISSYYEVPKEQRAKDLCEEAFASDNPSWGVIAVEELVESLTAFDPEHRREELIQLAAVCISWIDSIDRNELYKSPKKI